MSIGTAQWSMKALVLFSSSLLNNIVFWRSGCSSIKITLSYSVLFFQGGKFTKVVGHQIFKSLRKSRAFELDNVAGECAFSSKRHRRDR